MTAATMAALLLLPASALAAESVAVDTGTLRYTSGDGTVDDVRVREDAGTHLVTEPTTPSGTIGAECVYVGGATAQCTGATSAALATLDGNDSVTVVGALPATIDAGPGSDTITAGDGDDTIEARDGDVDTIDCGAGTDTALADPFDVLSNCELPLPEVVVEPPVEVPPVVPPVEPPVEVPPVVPPVAPPVLPIALPDLAVLPVTLHVPAVVGVGTAGVVSFDLACAPTETAGCEGRVFLDPAPRGAKGKPRALASRRGRFGRSRFAVAAGRSARLRLRLTPAARKALGLPRGSRARAARRGRRVKAVVTVAPKGKAPTKTKVKLKS